MDILALLYTFIATFPRKVLRRLLQNVHYKKGVVTDKKVMHMEIYIIANI